MFRLPELVDTNPISYHADIDQLTIALYEYAGDNPVRLSIADQLSTMLHEALDEGARKDARS